MSENHLPSESVEPRLGRDDAAPAPSPVQAQTPVTGFRALPGSLRVLVAVNVALALAFAAVTLSPAATAQQATARPAGKYLVVGGKPPSGNTNAVFCIDTVNDEMIVLRWNSSRNFVEGVGYRNLGDDLQATPQR
ncbi:MAG: hypothetical protein AAF297_04050 [Planctomycetota bacterium]